MGNFLKDYGKSMVGMLLVLGGLMIVLNFATKLPLVGGVAKDAKNIVTDGTLNG